MMSVGRDFRSAHFASWMGDHASDSEVYTLHSGQSQNGIEQDVAVLSRVSASISGRSNASVDFMSTIVRDLVYDYGRCVYLKWMYKAVLIAEVNPLVPLYTVPVTYIEMQ